MKIASITKADLHIHSNFSDGSLSIEEIIDLAKAAQLDAIAITDHDTLSHLPHISRISASGIKITAGIEISAISRGIICNGSKAHILGYNIKNPRLITELTLPTLEARNKNSEKQAEILISQGYRISLDRLDRAEGKYLYKQHIMSHLVKTGQVPEMFGDFYKKTFKNGGVCDFDIDYPDVFEAVSLIKQAGGLAVLAHSGQQKNFELIAPLVKAGLAGLELNHHSHSESDREIIRECAARYSLFMTGGSDFHGSHGASRIGEFMSHQSGVEQLIVDS